MLVNYWLSLTPSVRIRHNFFNERIMTMKRSSKPSRVDALFLSYLIPDEGWRARWEPRWSQLLLLDKRRCNPLVYRSSRRRFPFDV